MCGIAGSISWDAAASRKSVQDMVDAIFHRGPDDNGIWVSPNKKCVLGHSRLSIIDLSEAGHQPMIDAATLAIEKKEYQTSSYFSA